MAHTNSTPNYGLPQWIGTDKPTFLGDFNTAFYDIDAQMKTNADAAASATTTANTAASAATTASTNATTALNTANSAASEAASATSAAASATATANTAAANAATALTASQANNIANLAPAYDPTLTYNVGDLVTYVDTETNTGKLYKCIVAVTSPMAFNLNYWDDVTTSEIYSMKAIIENSVTADGTKTYNQLLTELRPNSVDTTIRYTIVITTSTFNTVFTSTLLRDDLIAFASTRIGGSGITIETIAINLTSDCEYNTALIATSPAVTITDNSANVPPSGVAITLYGEKMN